MQSHQKLFPVGKVVGFQGLKGEVKVRPSTNNPSLLLDIEKVQIELASGQRIHATVKTLRLDRRLLIISFKEYGDRTAAEFLQDSLLYTDRQSLRNLEDDEWWVTDLVGLEVFTTDGAKIGKVIDIIDAGNQLLEIATSLGDSNDRTVLVPFVKALVPKVDMKQGRIEVVDIPGLLEQQ